MINYYALLLKHLDIKLELSVKFYDEIISRLRENKSYVEKRYKEEEVGEEDEN